MSWLIGKWCQNHWNVFSQDVLTTEEEKNVLWNQPYLLPWFFFLFLQDPNEQPQFFLLLFFFDPRHKSTTLDFPMLDSAQSLWPEAQSIDLVWVFFVCGTISDLSLVQFIEAGCQKVSDYFSHWFFGAFESLRFSFTILKSVLDWLVSTCTLSPDTLTLIYRSHLSINNSNIFICKS